MSKVITCEVSGQERKYLVIDRGVPLQRNKNVLLDSGGFEVFRCDSPFSPSKGNAWVGNFESFESVLEFVRMIRGMKVVITETAE